MLDLEDAWARAVRSVGATAGDDQVVAAGADLLTRWQEPHRHYHDVEHLGEVLAAIDELAPELVADVDVVRLAAWFHDAVYDTRRSTNEEECASLAALALRELGVPPGRIDTVRRLILATKRHGAVDDLPDLGLFLDADLAILGSENETCLAYAQAIREEYAWAPEAAYREGRIKVLKSFLRRERVYFTQEMAERLEALARSNMADEVRSLSS